MSESRPISVLEAPLTSFESAISFSVLSGPRDELRAKTFPYAPVCVKSALSEHDVNYTEPGMCLRFDLRAECVSIKRASTLLRAHPQLLGHDDALYDFERSHRSQMQNRRALLGRLVTRLAALPF